jgi:Flp pilus assembly protein TadG
MRFKHVMTLAAAALAVAAVPVAQAQQGTDPTASAKFKSKLVRVDKSTAVLMVKYQCSRGDTLWISAKQLKNGKASKALTKEGSSQIAQTWVQSHRNPIVCDGQSHTTVFVLDKVEPGSKGSLKAKSRKSAGKAYIQFCVTLPPTDPNGDPELTLSESGFVKVR